MFTTLCVIKPARRKQLFRRRRILTEEIVFGKNKFYTSRLVSYSSNNKSYIDKYIKDCSVPVIQPEDELTEEFKYHVLLSTVFKYCKEFPEIAIYDPSGSISYLLPRILSTAKAVYVFTNHSKYYDLNEYIYSQIGSAAIISEDIYSLKYADAIISSERLTHGILTPVLGKYNWFVNDCRPEFNEKFPDELPEYADIYSVASGIWKYMDIKNLIFGYCNQLNYKNIKINSENLIAKK